MNTLMAMPAAKGLFHKAINESGSFRSAMLEKQQTQQISAELLNVLGLPPGQVDSLQTIPFAKLVDAGRKAMRIVSDKMTAAGKPAPGFGLSWGPSIDGNVLPYQLFSQEAFSLSANVPLLIGTTKNEFAIFQNMALGNATTEQINDEINKRYKDKAPAYIAAVKKAYPSDTKPSDMLDVDATFRPGAVVQANMKSAIAGGAATYMYLFTWQSPTVGGKYKAVHCMEIPFVFNNIDRCKEMTGGTKEAYMLADKMSQAWINFARSGNPGHKGLPEWPAYNSSNTATMHFDNVCEVKPQMDKELFDLLGGN